MSTDDKPALPDFLLARIAEDEAVARATWSQLEREADSVGLDPGGRPAAWRAYHVEYEGIKAWPGDLPDWDRPSDSDLTHHMTRWNSARVLDECEAKRRIVEEHDTREVASLDRDTWGQPFDVCRRCREGEVRQIVAPCPTLCLLALPYADHPDYRAEWRVDADPT